MTCQDISLFFLEIVKTLALSGSFMIESDMGILSLEDGVTTTGGMTKKKSTGRASKKPDSSEATRRTGVPIQFYLDDDIYTLLQQYRRHYHATTGMKASLTDIGKNAFRAYLDTKDFPRE